MKKLLILTLMGLLVAILGILISCSHVKPIKVHRSHLDDDFDSSFLS